MFDSITGIIKLGPALMAATQLGSRRIWFIYHPPRRAQRNWFVHPPNWRL